MLRGESNVAIVPAIGGDVVEDICLGEFFRVTLAQAEYSGLLTEPEAALSLFFEHFRLRCRCGYGLEIIQVKISTWIRHSRGGDYETA